MNLVKLQATKLIWINLLHFYTLAVKMRKRNLRRSFMDYHIEKNEIHRNKTTKGFAGSSDGKESACSGGDLGSIPGSGRSPGEGNGNPLQYPCLANMRTEEPGELQSMGSQRVGHD